MEPRAGNEDASTERRRPSAPTKHLFVYRLPFETTAETLGQLCFENLSNECWPLHVKVLPPKRRKVNPDRTRAAFLDFENAEHASKAKAAIEQAGRFEVEFHTPTTRHTAAERMNSLGHKKQVQLRAMLDTTAQHARVMKRRRDRRAKILSDCTESRPWVRKPCLLARYQRSYTSRYHEAWKAAEAKFQVPRTCGGDDWFQADVNSSSSSREEVADDRKSHDDGSQLFNVMKFVSTSHAGCFLHFLTSFYPTTHAAGSIKAMQSWVEQNSPAGAVFRLMAFPPTSHGQVQERLQTQASDRASASWSFSRTDFTHFLVAVCITDHPDTTKKKCTCTESVTGTLNKSNGSEGQQGTFFFGIFDLTWKPFLLIPRAPKSSLVPGSGNPTTTAAAAATEPQKSKRMKMSAARSKASDAAHAGSTTCFILLDVDGVLHPLSSNGMPLHAQRDQWLARAERENALDDSGRRHDPLRVAEVIPGEFHEPCMAALGRVVRRTGAQIVLTSTWRLTGPGRRAVDAALINAGMPASSGVTPRVSVLRGGRSGEIRAWAEQLANPEASWVALDDLELDLPSEHFLHVDPNVGLTAKQADSLEHLLLSGKARQSPSATAKSAPSASSWQAVVNRAAHKVVEALWRLDNLTQPASAAPRSPSKFALDIGAAPGGWSHKLLTSGSALNVIALDPANLLPALKDKQHFSLASHLFHVQKRAEEAIPEVAEILGSSSSGNPDGIGICVCDANISGKAAVDKLLRPMLKFLEHGCRLVLTIKLQRRTGGEGVTKHNNETISALEELGFGDFHLFHLLSNTANERTLVARLQPDTA